MLFMKTFCLTSEFASMSEHKKLLTGCRSKITPRITAVASPFIVADMAKDTLMIIPVAGWVLNAAAGGVISGVAMNKLCDDVIPRLRTVATAFYALDMHQRADQESLDSFDELVDECFPIFSA